MEKAQVDLTKAGWLIVLGLFGTLAWFVAKPDLLRTRVSPIDLQRSENSTTNFTPPPTSAPRSSQYVGGVVAGIVGGVPGGVRQFGTGLTSPTADFGRKMVRSSSLQAVVNNPAETAQRVANAAEQLGGYVESSEIGGSKEQPWASMVIRVPANRLQEAESQISKLALRIENETTTVTDSTRDYVDREARLRNLRAEEAQYLSIMKSASKVKDMLAVIDKLSDVRGEIEQQQAEFDTLSKQVETASLKVSLQTEMNTQVFGLRWHPLYELKVAARDGLDSLATYVDSVLGVLFQLPAVALWMATVIFVGSLVWRLLRWVWRTFFASPQKLTPTPAS